ncbi:hypothetical protein G7Y89_g4662 [Cudoniella acicularis]|uniref:DUF7779 domain-containing protein n=1 Tax=Cudoniella acicularis TaxID=354080 RepID=A0A8H4RP00_9HELO|nr:hypothetical protein G7Y89_g4662 [Cudoniella acicularis]
MSSHENFFSSPTCGALTVLTDHYYNPACQHTLSQHIGTVFLGTPHPTFGQKNQWLRLSFILQTSSNKYAKALLAQAEIEAAIIANISLKFEQAGIEERIISVFETKPTKLSDGLFKSRKEILVDHVLAETRSKNEKIISSDSDHYNIAKIEEGTLLMSELINMINLSPVDRTLPSTANLNINLRVDDDNIWESTATDAEETLNQINTASPAIPTGGAIDVAKNYVNESISALTDLTKITTPRACLPCYLLQPFSQNPDFYGRSEVLEAIERILNPPDQSFAHMTTNSLRSVTLCGFGGIGKTQIALQYAFSSIRRGTYDAIFWVHADGKDKLANSFNEIAIQLKLIEAAETTDPVIVRNVVMEWLSKPSKAPVSELDSDRTSNDQALAKWLMIFDNADTPELLRDLWPVSGNGSVLVTSRDPQSVAYLHSTMNIDLLPFNGLEASRLVQKLALMDETTPEDEEASIVLCDRLGGYPLALVLISTIMLRKSLTIQEALELYDNEALSLDLYNAQISNPYDRYTNTLSSVWTSKDFDETTLFLLDILSLLDPDAIYESILQGEKSPDCPPALEAMQENYIDVRKELVRSSLVKRNTREKLLTIHRVVQDNILKRMSTNRRDSIFTYTVKMLLQAWKQDPEEKFTHLKGLWDISKRVSPHVNRLMRIYKSGKEAWNLSIEAQIDFARLLQKSGWYRYEIGHNKSCKPFFMLALQLCEQNATNDESKTLLADILFCLASSSGRQIKAQEALHFATRHFDVRMQIERKKEHLGRHAGLAYTELGRALLLNNRLEEAIQYNRDGKAILVELEQFKAGKYWPDFAIIQEAIALNGLNRGEEAIPGLQASIAFREKRYGPNDTESFKLGYFLQILGNIYSKKGNGEEAGKLYQRALSNYRATVGDHFYRTSQVCVKLAEHHARELQVEAANIYFDQALKNFKLHGFTKPELIRTMYRKAKFLENIENYDSAAQLMGETLVLYKELVPSHVAFEINDLNDELLDIIVPVWGR